MYLMEFLELNVVILFQIKQSTFFHKIENKLKKKKYNRQSVIEFPVKHQPKSKCKSKKQYTKKSFKCKGLRSNIFKRALFRPYQIKINLKKKIRITQKLKIQLKKGNETIREFSSSNGRVFANNVWTTWCNEKVTILSNETALSNSLSTFDESVINSDFN